MWDADSAEVAKVFGEDKDYTVQMFIELGTRQPCLAPPPLWAECQNRWRNGDFADLTISDNN